MTGPLDAEFVVTDEEVRAGRAAPEPPAPDGVRDRERTFLLGLVLLTIGFGLAWAPLAAIVPGAILTLVGLWSKAGGRS